MLQSDVQYTVLPQHILLQYCRSFGPTGYHSVGSTQPEAGTETPNSYHKTSGPGCHSDSGFAHEPRALYSQMIMGESWEAKDIDGDPPADPETGGSVGGTWPNPARSPGAVLGSRFYGKNGISEGSYQSGQLTVFSGAYMIQCCSTSTRGSYCTFVDRLDPRETPLFPQTLESRRGWYGQGRRIRTTLQTSNQDYA